MRRRRAAAPSGKRGDCAPLAEGEVAEEAGPADGEGRPVQDDRPRADAAVGDEVAAFDDAAGRFAQEQRPGVARLHPSAKSLAGCVPPEDRAGDADRRAGCVDGRRVVGVLPLAPDADALLVCDESSGVVALEYTVPYVQGGVLKVHGRAVRGHVAVADGEAVKTAVKCLSS